MPSAWSPTSSSIASPSGGALLTRCWSPHWPWRQWPRATSSGPTHLGRERHEDRLDVAAGHQAELGAAVVQQVELDVAAAAHQLVLALGWRPRLVHVRSHDLRIDAEEGLADGAGEGEVLGVVVLQIVVEDPADA